MRTPADTDLAAYLPYVTVFAMTAHGSQKRKGSGVPYIVHPLRVCETLRGMAGMTDPTILAVALLHDVLEDTPVTRDELAAEFGEEIASLVAELTNAMSLPKQARKDAMIVKLRSVSPRAALVKLADRYDNLGDMDVLDWPASRKLAYLEEARRLVASIDTTLHREEIQADAAPWLSAIAVFRERLPERIAEKQALWEHA